MDPTEAAMRDLVADLRPGDLVAVEHRVLVGQRRWTCTTEGRVVATTRRRHGLHHRRAPDDPAWSDAIVLKRNDGEQTTVTIDPFTQVRRVERAAE